ncbi:MAG: response regulator transcription factor [Betaproteobacteria bacterium]|nr:response regulator transcription factor [Betaproteobacteria bacterium]
MNTAMDDQVHPIRILLVDDHKCMLWGLDRLIASEHPRMQIVGKAGNRQEIFQALDAVEPDLILLDLDLNGESALDFLGDIQRRTPARVLVLTGLRDPQVHQRAILGGARGVVLKDVPAETILLAIQRVHAGEVWMDRGTMSRLLERLTSGPTGASSSGDPHAARIASLTAKERDIVAALVKKPGAPNKTLADSLCMSDHTLRNHLTAIYDKLGVQNRVALTLYAIEHQLAFGQA